MDHSLEVSWQTILRVFIAGFVFYVLFLARDILIWFLFALIISVLLEPAIGFLQKLKIPKVIAVILVYLAIFGILGVLIYLMAPVFLFEIKQLAQNIPEYFQKISPMLEGLGVNVAKNFEDLTLTLTSMLQESSGSIVKALTAFFGGVASAFLIFVFSFYLSLEERGTERFLSMLVPPKYEQLVMSIFERSQAKVSGWFGARILGCLFVGVLSFIVFFLFGVKYSFILALISGLLNFVPFVGPLITWIAALVFVGVADSWVSAVYVILALAVIQEIENKLVTPLLIKKFLDLPPILVLLSILIGGKLFGMLGIIFMVPLFGIVYEFVKEFLQKKKADLSLVQSPEHQA